MVEFNKMYVMLPVIIASRYIKGEDPQIVLYVRIAYFSVQAVIVLFAIYTYIQATIAAQGKEGTVIYVPSPTQPFADPNAKKKYTETTFGTHLVTQARNLLGSTLFGICLTSGLHFYRGMVVGLAIQSIMGPLTLLENPLVKALIFGKGMRAEDKIFQEKTANDLAADDEVVDSSGNPIVRTLTTRTKSNVTFEEVLLDTWDAGAKADLGPLMEQINDQNCNHKTKENDWTPLMILSGLCGVKGIESAIKHVLALGADPSLTDVEGWNAMHWAAFHGSSEAASILGNEGNLCNVLDKEGKTPLVLARAEGNNEVVKILEEIAVKSKESSEPKKDR